MIAFAYMSGPGVNAGVVPVTLEVTENSMRIVSNGAMIDLPIEYVYQALKEHDERSKKCTV